MAANYLDIRHAHFRITLRDWLRGLDKALIAIASALTFILTAIVAMIVYGMAQALALLPDAGASPAHRLAVIAAWQVISFVLLRALREAALMPRAAAFFDSLPVPARHKIRADAVLALLAYSFLWLPMAWALADPLGERHAPLAGMLAEFAALVSLSVALNLTLLRGRRTHAATCSAALVAYAWPIHSAWIEIGRVLCGVAAVWVLWLSYQPGAARAPTARSRSAWGDALALRSGLVIPLLANELHANLFVRIGAILAAVAACLMVLGLRTNDASTASVLLFVAAAAALALYSLPALLRRTLMTKLGFLAGQPAFARRLRFTAYFVPSALFCAALLLGWMFDRGGRPGLDAGIFSLLYLIGVCGARLELRVTPWFMPFITMMAVIILGAMT